MRWNDRLPSWMQTTLDQEQMLAYSVKKSDTFRGGTYPSTVTLQADNSKMMETIMLCSFRIMVRSIKTTRKSIQIQEASARHINQSNFRLKKTLLSNTLAGA